jgi:hypothetical protein
VVGMEKGAESKKTTVLRLENFFSESGTARSCTGNANRERARFILVRGTFAVNKSAPFLYEPPDTATQPVSMLSSNPMQRVSDLQLALTKADPENQVDPTRKSALAIAIFMHRHVGIGSCVNFTDFIRNSSG